MEYRDSGLTIMCAAPYYVVSNMSKIRRPSLTTPTATTYAASVLAQLGTTTFTYGFWAHDLVAAGIRSVLGLLLLLRRLQAQTFPDPTSPLGKI